MNFLAELKRHNVIRVAGMAPEPGAILWGPALAPHAVRNVGTRELHVIAIELKIPTAEPGNGSRFADRL